MQFVGQQPNNCILKRPTNCRGRVSNDALRAIRERDIFVLLKMFDASIFNLLSQVCRFDELHGFAFNKLAFDCL
jgi:hypothetical protein